VIDSPAPQRYLRVFRAIRGCFLLLPLLLSFPVAAQTKKPASKKKAAAPPVYNGPSTQQGIYTNEQANRGKNVYLGSCRSCHTPQSHTGATFNQFWRNHQLNELFSFVATKMPKNDPGSLAPEDVADVVAYLLKMNAMPAGKDELYPDADSLKQFRIETKRTTSTAKRAKP